MKLELNEILSILLYEPIMLVMVVIMMIVSVKFFAMNVLVMITFFYIFMLLAPQVRMINNFLMQIVKNLSHFSRVYEIIYWKGHCIVPKGTVQIDKIHSEIDIHNLSFRYRKTTKPVLKDVNLNICKGSKVAFVGMSGGGKSTLLDILIRHHPISEGKILIDGIDLMEIKAEAWNRLIGVVEQTPYIFQGSVRDNICFGKLHATEDEVVEAAKAAYAHNFILQMPNGYDTAVGNQGIELSGGQKQRIALARALIKNPEILMLDEATSALDSESEKFIQDAISKIQGVKTILIVAHRLSTVVSADKIVFVEDGRIKEIGNHAELIKANGRYKDYYNLQSQVIG
jgi:subfamily B ATP-binding cassette protein MsbA